MKFLSKKGVSRRVFGAELIVTGGVLLMAAKVLASVAPFALSVYGVYRLVLRRSYPDGITYLASGILLLTILKGFDHLLWVPILLGIGMVGVGGYYMFVPGARKQIGED